MTHKEAFLESRHMQLDWLQQHQRAMLAELGSAISSLDPSALADAPEKALPELAAFVERTDFGDATEDARIWLVLRLGLYLARLLMHRHGGTLQVEERPESRFRGRFVIAGMRSPLSPVAAMAPFALANDIVFAPVKLSLLEMIEVAEAELRASGTSSGR